MVREYEIAVHLLEPGARTGIFETPFGFHIAMLIGKAPARAASLGEAGQGIRDMLFHERQRSAYIGAVKLLLQKAEIRRTEETNPRGAKGRRMSDE